MDYLEMIKLGEVSLEKYLGRVKEGRLLDDLDTMLTLFPPSLIAYYIIAEAGGDAPFYDVTNMIAHLDFLKKKVTEQPKPIRLGALVYLRLRETGTTVEGVIGKVLNLAQAARLAARLVDQQGGVSSTSETNLIRYIAWRASLNEEEVDQ